MIHQLPKGTRDLTGQTFGSLTPQYVVEMIPGAGALWHCDCACGGSHEVLATHLRRGRSRYCERCAREHRKEQLARARSSIRSIDGMRAVPIASDLPPAARPYFDEMIARRRRMGVRITLALIASCRQIALMEVAQASRASCAA
jgi:hypothetical protein